MDPAKVTTITRYSTGTQNPDVVDLTREFRGKSNGAFFAEVRKRLNSVGQQDSRFAHGGKGAIGLIGEYGLTGMAIRNAQRHLRLDKQPSHWSHTFLFFDEISANLAVNRNSRRSPWIWESTLEPPDPFSHYGDLNAVSPRRLSDYDY